MTILVKLIMLIFYLELLIANEYSYGGR